MAFCNVSEDRDLVNYKTLEEMLGAEFIPGNYDPTKGQAKELITCAAKSAIRWYQLHLAASLIKDTVPI